MFDFNTLMGMPYEDLVEFIEEQGWDYGWEMDQLYVSDRADHFVWIGLTNWAVSGWEAV